MNGCSLLEEILRFSKKQASYNFIQQIFTKDKRITQIGEYRHQIGTMVAAFQVRVYPSPFKQA
jgi:hypothetical protein